MATKSFDYEMCELVALAASTRLGTYMNLRPTGHLRRLPLAARPERREVLIARNCIESLLHLPHQSRGHLSRFGIEHTKGQIQQHPTYSAEGEASDTSTTAAT